MLCLQVTTPADGVFERASGLLQQLDRIGVINTPEVAVDDLRQLADNAFFRPLVKESHLVGAVFQHAADDGFDEILRNADDVVDIRKADLRLNLPEFCGMAGGVGMLGAEGGTECVDASQPHGSHLTLQLGRDGQSRLATEEVLGEILLLGFGIGCPRLCGHAEHLTRPLAVRSGNDGGMNVAVAVAVEVLMHRLCQLIAHGEHCLKRACTHAQVRDGAQILQRVALFLQREVRRAFAEDGERFQLQLAPVAL